jgi:FixJ family two-component response regulator
MNRDPTVFVVDSDPATREAVCKVAQVMGRSCEVYSSGEEFLGNHTNCRPGCLVLELQLPDINGFHLQERLAAQETCTPVIFVAKDAPLSIAVQAMRGGAVHFLQKPVREHDLWKAIEEALELDRERRETMMRRKAYESKMAELTENERHLLFLICEGEARKTIAKEMKVCVRTVELWLARLKEKLGVTSFADLMRFALAVDGQLDASNKHSTSRSPGSTSEAAATR